MEGPLLTTSWPPQWAYAVLSAAMMLLAGTVFKLHAAVQGP